MCLLRAMRRDAEAASVESVEFAPALTAARSSSEGGADEATILAEEEARVSSAGALAELIAPLLADQLRGELMGVGAVSTLPVQASARTPTSPNKPVAPPAEHARVPGIADLIDGMLSQESALAGGRARP